MAFLQSSAATPNLLLSTLATFAVAQGWTAEYNDASTTGQIGLSKGNCKVAIGIKVDDDTGFVPQLYTGTDYNIYTDGTYEDTRLCLVALNTLNASNKQYWGHPGSACTSYADADDFAYVNDMTGPFSNIYLFSPADGNSITVVVQTAADRFAHFGFGVLDKQGLTHPDVGYVMGQYFQWWGGTSQGPNQSNYYANNFATTIHTLGSLLHPEGFFLALPDGVVDPVYGFPDGPYVSRLNIIQPMTFYSNDPDVHLETAGEKPINNIFSFLENQNVAGGTPMLDIPVIISRDTYNNFYEELCTYLGRLPDLRMIKIANLNPAQEVKIGSDVWQVFPHKRKSHPSMMYGNATPDYRVSSGHYGIAVKKVL